MLPIVLAVLDGAGDLPDSRFGNRTPLEVAETPNLDLLARKGIMGRLYTVGRGIAPESDASVLSLLGYDPLSTHLARGVVEAMGAGIAFKEGDLALRCGFATVSGDLIIDRRAGRDLSPEEARLLADSINGGFQLSSGVSFEFKATVGHRAVLVLRRREGIDLSDEVSNLDPAYERVGTIAVAKAGLQGPMRVPRCEPLSDSASAIQTAEMLNEFADKARAVLEDHEVNSRRREIGKLPANFIVMRDAGCSLPKVPTIHERFGLRSVMLADLPVELGIAKVLGMSVESFAHERSLEAYGKRAERVLDLMDNFDFIYAHIKGPDEPGHDGNFKEKVLRIEEIDRGFFSRLLQDAKLNQAMICVTSDHSTPCQAKGHTDDPVPILIVGKGISSDGLERFTEKEARRGSLGIMEHGYLVLPLLKKYAVALELRQPFRHRTMS